MKISKLPTILLFLIWVGRRLRKAGKNLGHVSRHYLWICIEEDRVWCTICNETLSQYKRKKRTQT